MKRISIFLFAAAALWWGGCEESSDTDSGIPVSVVVLDASLSGGIVLEAGQTQNIAGKVSFLPENATDTAETYASSDPEIVSVDESGLVAALQQGSAMVTVTVGGKHAHFEVAVEAQKVPVESVTLPEELAKGVSLQIGATLNIAGQAIVAPENATATAETYASSDEAVATVGADGVVTAVALGTTTITVTVDGQSASFELTVTKVPVASVTLPENLAKGISLEPNQTLDIAGAATVLPENATYKTETYASSDTEVATVSDEGVVTALKEGTATITVTVDGVEASFVLTVAADVPVAIEKIEIKNGATDTQGSASVELGTNTTFNLYEHLVLTPANQNEGVKYVAYGSEDIATIDENGIVTCKGVGTVTFVILPKSNTANDFKNAGAKKAYFAVNITDPHDFDRTGWTVSARSHNLPGAPVGNSDTALFDDTFDPNVFKDVKGSNFGMATPGKKSTGSNPVDATSDNESWFVVDMQQEQSVNYVRIMHTSCRNTDRVTRLKAFAEILGSNDGTTFTSIATDVVIPDLEHATGIDPNDGGSRALDKSRTCSNVKFTKSSYRYVKFVVDKSQATKTDGVGGGTTFQIAELYLGLDE
ncbi:MAG: Ig-like domain-containing protein [Alistipes senegalensis]|nr:Ig-like domain-containing protein [Bacteroides cellulosilyticus]MCM1351997.1 Ig-like domain-containing protein [Alistipes senegalensis]